MHHKKQHYLPKTYLRYFSANHDGVYVFDKQANKPYFARMDAICMKSNLYTISNDVVEKNKDEYENLDTLAYEKGYFAETIEPMLSQCLQVSSVIKDEWISGKDNYRLLYKEKKEIALHIVTLFLRHPIIKESVISDFSRMQKAELDIVKNFVANQLGDPRVNDLEIGIEFDNSIIHANSTYMDHEQLDRIATVMAENYWIFWYRKKKEFYTSDFPIVVVPHVKDAKPVNWGLTQYGGELTFPLFPDCVLSIYDRRYFSQLSDEDCTSKEADDKRTRELNFYRYLYAERHVLSYTNDFKFIEFLFNHFGEHRFSRINLQTTIVSGFGKY